jgi:membrane protease YdiL (CAAX protease family)
MATTAAARGGLFLGADRKLQPIWRAISFFILAGFVLVPLIGYLTTLVYPPPPGAGLHLTPTELTIGEAVNFAAALIATALFAWYEHRRIDSYGLPVDAAFKSPTWEGFAVGVAQTTVVGLAMFALGGMQVHGFALVGTAIVTSALAWLAACICVGLGEEFLIRGYFLQTLWKAIGFWPAAVVIAAIFAGIHYLLKPGENVPDMLALVSFSMLCSYSVLRTGNLWFAVGLHIAYDFMQFFAIGTPNGGQIPPGRLLDATFNGPAWLTGGPLGTEASWFGVPLDLLAFVYIWWRYRSNPDYCPR